MRLYEVRGVRDGKEDAVHVALQQVPCKCFSEEQLQFLLSVLLGLAFQSQADICKFAIEIVYESHKFCSLGLLLGPLSHVCMSNRITVVQLVFRYACEINFLAIDRVRVHFLTYFCHYVADVFKLLEPVLGQLPVEGVRVKRPFDLYSSRLYDQETSKVILAELEQKPLECFVGMVLEDVTTSAECLHEAWKDTQLADNAHRFEFFNEGSHHCWLVVVFMKVQHHVDVLEQFAAN